MGTRSGTGNHGSFEMPFYDWKCKHCPLEVSVMRTVGHYNLPPQSDEAKPSDTHIHEFEKVLGATPTTFKHNDRKAHKS